MKSRIATITACVMAFGILGPAEVVAQTKPVSVLTHLCRAFAIGDLSPEAYVQNLVKILEYAKELEAVRSKAEETAKVPVSKKEDARLDAAQVAKVELLGGRVRRRFTRDPNGTRYEIVGPATDGRQVAVVCRIKETGKLLFITTYALEIAL